MEGPMEQNTENFELALEYVSEKEEMSELAEACFGEGEWNPTLSDVQPGGVEEPQPGPSNIPDTP